MQCLIVAYICLLSNTTFILVLSTLSVYEYTSSFRVEIQCCVIMLSGSYEDRTRAEARRG